MRGSDARQKREREAKKCRANEISKERGRYERIIIRGAYAQSCLYKLARTNTYDLKTVRNREKDNNSADTKYLWSTFAVVRNERNSHRSGTNSPATSTFISIYIDVA